MKRKTVVITVIAVILIGFIVMLLRNAPAANLMRFGIFSELKEVEALNGYVVSEDDQSEDAYLKDLIPDDAWAKTVEVNGSKCEVRAYVFCTNEDAAEYYKRASNRTNTNDGANGSASAGGFFGPATYVTLNERNVLFISGKSFAQIGKVLDAFFEANPNASAPFDRE